MSPRSVMTAVMAGLVAGLFTVASAPAQIQAPVQAGRPNVVLLLADDLGWGDVGCYHGAGRIATPHLDRLAAAGVRFTDAHSSSGVCVPSRFSLLTGQHAFRMTTRPHAAEAKGRGQYGGNQATTPLIPEDCPTLPGLLAQAGYATSMIGKWHLGFEELLARPAEPLRGGPVDRGFQRYFGIPASLDIGPYVYIEGDRIVAQATEPMPAGFSPGWPDPRMGAFWREDRAAPGFKHADVLPECTRRAEAELKRLAQAAKERPFFFYYALPAPHSPLLPAPEFQGRTKVGVYGDYVTQTDDAIGRMLRVLDETGVEGQTIVLASSDNGPFWYPDNVTQTGHAAAGPWRGMKGDAWEGGHRVPLIARWPGRFATNHASEATVSLTDLLQTIAAWTGTACDSASADGVDCSAAFRGEDWIRPAEQPLVVRSSLGANIVRAGRWKLIDRLGSAGFSHPNSEQAVAGRPQVQLYDLTADPGEKQNLAATQAPVVAELQARLAAQRKGR